MLETVTVDLYIIRNLGLVLRKFPQVFFLFTLISYFILLRCFIFYTGNDVIPNLPCLSLLLFSFQISIDVVGLVDEWAARFFEELDYVNEGENASQFAEMMRKDLPQVC